jgi:uncharacterized protein
MPRIVHFDIPADDPERAAKFYTDVFDWKIEKWNGPMEYWMAMTGPDDEPGINGGLAKRQGNCEGQGISNTIGVPSVDDYSAKVEAGGGKVLMPKMAIPGVGYFAQCEDTEGNKFGIIEMDEAAK